MNTSAVNTVEFARRVRLQVLAMTSLGGTAHIGSCFSQVDILAVLYGRILRVDPENPAWEDRDRFILSKGHAANALYELSVAGNSVDFSGNVSAQVPVELLPVPTLVRAHLDRRAVEADFDECDPERPLAQRIVRCPARNSAIARRSKGDGSEGHPGGQVKGHAQHLHG